MTPDINAAALAGLITERVSRSRCTDLLVALVRAPSPQTSLLEGEPQVKAFIASQVQPIVRALGPTDIRLDSMGNLIARFGERRSGRSIMLVGHAMTQPPASMPDPYEGRIVDGAEFGLPGACVVGRGASEQKADLAAMLHALEVVTGSGRALSGELIFVCCVSGESGRHDAIRHVVERGGVRADMAVLNGASGEISLGNRGRVDIHLTVRGAPCHSGMPWAGANAVTGGAELVRRLAARFDSGAPHPELGRKTLTATHIRSFPDSTHTVQERCELTLDRRLLPGEEPEAAFDRVMETAREIESFNDPVSGRPFAVEGRIGAFMYPSLVEPDAPIVQALQRASVALTGARAPTRYSPTAFDQGYLNHVGIPAVNFGAGEPRFAHTDFDMASVERTVVACQVYCYAVIERLGQ